MYVCVHACMCMCVCMCVYVCMNICMYVCMHVCMYVLAAYTQHCPADVNMKHYRSLSNFGLVTTLISFWQPKLPIGVANKNPHTLPQPPVVINAHPVTWIPYAKFQLDWSINTFLACMMS